MATPQMTFIGCIDKANKVHNGFYTYPEENVFTGAKGRLNVLCPKHGPFETSVRVHLGGSRCKKCANEIKGANASVPLSVWLERAYEKHKGKYDLSKVHLTYKNSDSRVIIICPEHGEFEQNAESHSRGYGCNKCANDYNTQNKTYTQQTFEVKSNDVHKGKYGYTKAKYINSLEPVIITCPIHGDFEQRPVNHMRGYGCPKCGIVKVTDASKLSIHDWKIAGEKVHGVLYDYISCKAVDERTYLDISCKDHGLFTQRADTHIKGSGCPKCVASKGEKAIMEYFKTTNINYIKEHKIDGFKYRFDFYIPELNVVVEYDGHHHFKSIDIWGGDKYLEKTLRIDKAKEVICKKNEIALIRIPYTAFDNLYDILSRQLSLRFNYRVNGVFYKNIITLCKELSLSPNTSSKDLYEYNTYDQLMSMFKE